MLDVRLKTTIHLQYLFVSLLCQIMAIVLLYSDSFLWYVVAIGVYSDFTGVPAFQLCFTWPL